MPSRLPVFPLAPLAARAIRSRATAILRDWRELASQSIQALDPDSLHELESDLAGMLDRLALVLEVDDDERIRTVLQAERPPGRSFRGGLGPLEIFQAGRILRVAIMSHVEGELGRALTLDETASITALLDQMTRDAPGPFKSTSEAVSSEPDARGRTEETFFSLIQSSPFGVYIVDSRFRLRQVSAGARKVFENVRPLLGRDFAEVLRTIWEEPFATEAIDRFRHTLETGEPYVAVDTTEQRHDIAEVESYDWRIERITLPDGEFGVVCHFYDLSDIKRAQLRLAQSEARYRTLFDSIDEGFCVIEMIFDEDGRPIDYQFVETNPAFERHTGLSDAVGKRMRDLVPEHEQYWFDVYGRIATSGESLRFENRARGLNRWYDVYAFRMGEPGENKVAVLFDDVTREKRVERSLRESEERLRIATAAAQLGLHDYDVSSGNVQWDARTRALFGVGPDEPITYDLWRTCLHPDDLEGAVAAVQRAIDPDGDGRYFAQYRIVHRTTGATRWIEATGQVTFSDGRPLRLVGTAQDITERKRAEEALKEADRRKDEFIATLAHELRNPLAPIRMAVEALEGERDDPSRVDQMLEVIARQSHVMTRLVDDLLDVSRLTRGKIVLRKERVDVAMLFAHAAEAVRPTVERKGLELVVEVPDDPLTTFGDPVRLAQIVGNLLSNACKFTEGGSVRVSAERMGDDVVIRVVDTGSGIAPEDRERIFEMFAQAGRDERQAPQEGLGIGLPLVRSLARMHGGDLTVDSEVERGSVFTVRLPVADADHPAMTEGDEPRGERATPAEPPRPRAVLVVDDNLDVLAALRLLLERRGHSVLTAATGERCLEIAEESRPDAIILDIGLPGLDGYEVARRLRAEPWGREIRLVAMTGWGQPRDKALAREAGFDHHLTKPADPELLQRAIVEPVSREGEPVGDAG